MTKRELETWLESSGAHGKTHYDDLRIEAKAQLRTVYRDKRADDSGDDVAQQALTRLLDTEKFGAMSIDLAWPWLVGAIRSVVSAHWRSVRRANPTHHERPGAISSENDDEAGHGYIGPRADWQGEYTVSYLGPCGACQGGHSWSRIEVGLDRERGEYSKARAVKNLLTLAEGAHRLPVNSLDRTAHFLVGALVVDATHTAVPRVQAPVIGCWNGHREYPEAN